MGKWEYRMIHVQGAPIDGDKLKGFMKEANELGSDGWEAFAVTEDNTGWWVFLKRPRK